MTTVHKHLEKNSRESSMRRRRPRVVTFADTQKAYAGAEVFMEASAQRQKESVELVRKHRKELVN